MQSYIPSDEDFVTFITIIRANYDHWFSQEGPRKYVLVSKRATLATTLEEVYTSTVIIHHNRKYV